MNVLIVGGVTTGLGVALSKLIEVEYQREAESKQKKCHCNFKEVRNHLYPWYKKVK